MNDAPVNLKLSEPSIYIEDWEIQKSKWKTLNESINGNPNFFPLTIKAAYVIGIIHDYCESIDILCQKSISEQVFLMPAFSLLCSAVEILGRCISGNSSTTPKNDLKNGFKWLANLNYKNINDDYLLYSTHSEKYSIKYLVSLRNFASHGQSTISSTNLNILDEDILNPLPELLANGLERFWSKLMEDEDFCNNLAKANIIPFRNWPILNSWILFERDKNGIYHSITEIFSKYEWG